jgi:AcrR family transcriptional regulator
MRSGAVKIDMTYANTVKAKPGNRTKRAARPTNQELRDVSVARIHNAALTLFVRSGFAATTIDQIAAAAKLTKGGVYFYIGKKELLLLEIVETIKKRYVEDFIQLNDGLNGTALNRLVALMHWQVNFARENPREIMLLVKLSITKELSFKPVLQTISTIYQMIQDIVSNIIEEGQARGEVATWMKTREFAFFFIATHDGMMLEWYRRQKEIDGREFVRVWRELMLRSLKP